MSLKLETLGSVTWSRRNQQTFRHIFFNNCERIVRRSWVEVPFLYMNIHSPFFWWNLYPHIRYIQWLWDEMIINIWQCTDAMIMNSFTKSVQDSLKCQLPLFPKPSHSHIILPPSPVLGASR